MLGRLLVPVLVEVHACDRLLGALRRPAGRQCLRLRPLPTWSVCQQATKREDDYGKHFHMQSCYSKYERGHLAAAVEAGNLSGVCRPRLSQHLSLLAILLREDAGAVGGTRLDEVAVDPEGVAHRKGLPT